MFDDKIVFSIKNFANNRFVACSDNGEIYTDAFNYGQGRHEWRVHFIDEAKYFCFENLLSSKILIFNQNKVCGCPSLNYKENYAGHWVLCPVEGAGSYYLMNRLNKKYIACSNNYDLLTEAVHNEEKTFRWIIGPSGVICHEEKKF